MPPIKVKMLNSGSAAEGGEAGCLSPNGMFLRIAEPFQGVETATLLG